MIVAYLNEPIIKAYEITAENQNLLKEAIWIDLISATNFEEAMVEQFININIPTREEMTEIELSSRLYKNDGVLFMTAQMLAHSASPEPNFDSVSFILTQKQLITIRYIQPQSFNLFAAQLQKFDSTQHNAPTFLINLLDTNIDRLADTLEMIGRRLDDYSKSIFKQVNGTRHKPDYLKLMQQMGTNGDLNTKARESLLTFHRLLSFFGQSISSRINSDNQYKLSSLLNDIAALSDHADFLSNKINFLLDATLGMVGIEQNNIIKIFSVAAVIFLPPTLVASIYGMNFHFMPELSWRFGYLFAVFLMLIVSYMPYKYFKRKKWL